MPPHQDLPAWLLALFIPFFVTVWVSVGWIISQLGWSDFAREYGVLKIPDGDRFQNVSGQFSLQGSYRNVLNVSISHEGVGLSLNFLFRAFHPPICVPWSNVTVTEIDRSLGQQLRVELKGSNRTFRVFLPIRAKYVLEQYCRIEDQKTPHGSETLLRVILLVWFVALFGAGLVLEIHFSHEVRSIEQHLKITTGTVVELPSHAHSIVLYQFVAGGRTYQNQAQSEDPNPPANRLKLGESVTVFYDEQNPQLSMISEPKSEIMAYELGAVLTSLLIAAVVIINLASLLRPSWYKTTKRSLFG